MKVSQFVKKALVAGLAVGCGGCATSGTSWLPAWPGTSSTASAIPGRTGAQGVLGSPAPQPTGLAAAWQQTTKSFTNAVTPATATEPDPVALQNNPKKIGGEVYLSAARIHEQRGDFAGAIQQYQKAIETNPKDTTAYIGLGRIHDRLGEYAKAVQQYQKAIQLDPKRAIPRNDLGLCYARHGDLNKSINELQQAIKLQPDSKLYRNNLATVLVEANREQEALQQLMAAHPPAAAHYNLGALLSRCGKKEAAAMHLQQALATDPSLTAAQELLAQLEQPASPSDATPVATATPVVEASQVATSQNGGYPTGNWQEAAAKQVETPSPSPTTVTPYAPGSIYHISDDEPSPVFMGQHQSRKEGTDDEKTSSNIRLSSFQSKPAWRKHLKEMPQESRENTPPQTLELNEDFVQARPVPTETQEPDHKEFSELRPVTAELEIEAP